MAFPWNRSDSSPEMLPADRRSRARNRRNRQDEATRENTRLAEERRHQRLVWAIGTGLILIIAGVIAAGYYEKFFRPPRVWAGNVRDVEFTMGDLVERIRVLQGLTGQVDLSVVPFEYLQNQLNAEILRQASPGLGISITDEDIDRALRAQFLPQAAVGDQVAAGQLDQEFRQNYSAFLTRTGLSESEYHVILEEQIAELQLRHILAESIPETADQVEVEWIRLDPTGNVEPMEVRERLDIQKFGQVAAEVGTPDQYVNDVGYVGWVPQGAFPGLDGMLFGDGETSEDLLSEGEISVPVSTVDGIYIVHKLTTEDGRDINDLMRGRLLFQAVHQWQMDQLTRGSKEGWLKMNFNSKWYSWVAEQVGISAPRHTQGVPR